MQSRAEEKPQPIQLNTKIIQDGKEIKPFIHKEGKYSIVLSAKDDKSQQFFRLGHVSYFLVDDLFRNDAPCLYVEHIESYLSGNFKNVGTALHEFAFRESVRLGGYGRVTLSVNERSHYFHLQCGFSPSPYKREYCVPKEHRQPLTALFHLYLCERSPITKAKIDEYLVQYQLKEAVTVCARKRLNKSDTDEITFDEMIEYGLYWENNGREEIEKKFAEIKMKYPNQRPTLDDEDHFSDMYLPIAEINKKLKQFGLTINEPNIYKRKDIFRFLFDTKQQFKSKVEPTATDSFLTSYRL